MTVLWLRRNPADQATFFAYNTLKAQHLKLSFIYSNVDMFVHFSCIYRRLSLLDLPSLSFFFLNLLRYKNGAGGLKLCQVPCRWHIEKKAPGKWNGCRIKQNPLSIIPWRSVIQKHCSLPTMPSGWLNIVKIYAKILFDYAPNLGTSVSTFRLQK